MITKQRTGWILLTIVIVIQFIRPGRNISNNTQNDISKLYPMPDTVKTIIKASCSDCHSNYTVYPWYTNVQPVGWWLNSHINDGKRHLNFSEFTAYPAYRQYDKLKGLVKLVDDEEMPLSSYTLIHRYAVLDLGQRQILTDWAKNLQHLLRVNYPADSLANPKNRKK